MSRIYVLMKSAALVGCLAMGGHAVAAQATVGLMSGRNVTGEVVADNEETIQLRTEYGDLTFRKMDIKSLTYQGGAPNFGSAGGSSAGANPFGGSASTNVFGGAGATPAPVDTSSANPFAIPADGSTFNPFEATTGTITEEVSVAAPAGIDPPEVPQIWDAVLFDIREGSTARVKAGPGVAAETVAEDRNLQNGASIETASLPVRIVFKNGVDVARIAPGSLVRVVESGADRIDIDLQRGAVWMDLATTDSPQTVRVNTPIAWVQATGGGAFRVADALDHGIHVALIDGDVAVGSVSAQIDVNLKKNHMLLVRPDGAITPQTRLNRIVAQEYRGWDALAADWWEDMRTMIAETNPVGIEERVSVSELQEFLRKVGAAFGRFAEDTGHIPTNAEGFSVLVQNRGNWNEWAGPYWEGSLPPLDSWGRPMRYRVRSAMSDHMVGIVYSLGPDQIDNEGDPAADVTELVLYYQLEI